MNNDCVHVPLKFSLYLTNTKERNDVTLLN